MGLTITFSMRDTGSLRELALKLHGGLDTDTARTLHQRLSNLPEADRVCIDLTNLDFIDSGGLRVLVTAKRELSDELRIIGAQPPIAHVFERAGAAEVLERL
jgi:anti-anti-sigma factor